jgi:hypothetical protein
MTDKENKSIVLSNHLNRPSIANEQGFRMDEYLE